MRRESACYRELNCCHRNILSERAVLQNVNVKVTAALWGLQTTVHCSGLLFSSFLAPARKRMFPAASFTCSQPAILDLGEYSMASPENGDT